MLRLLYVLLLTISGQAKFANIVAVEFVFDVRVYTFFKTIESPVSVPTFCIPLLQLLLFKKQLLLLILNLPPFLPLCVLIVPSDDQFLCFLAIRQL